MDKTFIKTYVLTEKFNHNNDFAEKVISGQQQEKGIKNTSFSICFNDSTHKECSVPISYVDYCELLQTLFNYVENNSILSFNQLQDFCPEIHRKISVSINSILRGDRRPYLVNMTELESDIRNISQLCEDGKSKDDEITEPITTEDKSKGSQKQVTSNTPIQQVVSVITTPANQVLPTADDLRKEPIAEVPISFAKVKEYLDIKPNYLDILQDIGITEDSSVTDILDVVQGSLSPTRWNRIQIYKEQLIAEKDEIVNAYQLFKRRNQKHVVPVLTDEERSLPLFDRIMIAAKQTNEILRNDYVEKDSNRLADVIEQYLINGNNLLGVKDALGNSYQNHQQTFSNDFVKFKNMMNGVEMLYDKISSSRDIQMDIAALKDETMYKDSEEFISACGIPNDYVIKESGLASLLGIDITTDETNVSQQFIVKINEVNIVKQYLEYIYRALVSNSKKKNYNYCIDSRPKSMEDIVNFIELYNSNFMIDNTILETLLDSYSYVECVTIDGETHYQAKYYTLTAVEDKIARLLIEANGEQLSSDDLINLDSQKPGVSKDEHAEFENNVRIIWTRLKDKYNQSQTLFVTNGNGLYNYNINNNKSGSPRKAIIDYIQSLGNKLFTYQDIVDYIKEEGYPIPNSDKDPYYNKIRSNISTSALSAVDDPNLFCPKEFIDNHTDKQWRNYTSEGPDAYAKRMVEILLKCPDKKLMRSKLCTQVKADLPEYNSYPYSVVKRYSLIKDKDGDCLWTLTDSNEVVLNNKYNSFEDFVIDDSSYYMDILAKTIEILSESEEKTVLLSDIMNLCKPIYENKCSYTNFYSIINRFLGNEIEKIVKDGKQYLHLIEEKIEVAPSFVAKQSEENEEVIYVEDTRERTATITEGKNTTWQKLKDTLNDNLSGYAQQFDDLNAAIEFFAEFMDNVEDREQLRTYYPYNIWQFFNCDMNKYLLYSIFENSINCFEGIVKEIYKKRNNGREMERTIGLKAVVDNLENMSAWLNDGWYDRSNSMVQYYRDLYFNRNNLDHCEPINKIGWQYNKAITEYLVLAIYVVNKFAVK